MRNLILALALLASPALACEMHAVHEPAKVCDWLAGAGAAHRYQDGYTGPTAKAACSLKDGDWEVALHAFGEQRAYNNKLRVDPYLALTGQRVVTFRDGKLLRPFMAAGLMLKDSDKCHDKIVQKGSKGSKKRKVYDLQCNRLVPDFWAFALTAGLWIGDDWRLSLVNHWSTGGASFPNSGQDFLLVERRF